MSESLKPCPFCGGKAMFLTIRNKPLHSDVGVMFKIKCMKCGTELPKSYECEMYMDQDGGIRTGRDERTIGILIDAETLKQELYQQWFMDILLTQKRSDDMFYALAQKIDAQPTAYDTDKVVEQLEEVEKIMTSPVNKDCFGEECKASDCMVCLISKAIEIVKGGGVDG